MRFPLWIIGMPLLACAATSNLWSNEDFTSTRKEILAWWKESGPKPVLQCSVPHHQESVTSDTMSLDAGQSKTILNRLHTLVMKSDNQPFFGLNETFRALRSRSAELIIMTERTRISVYDFRNPLTGHHFFHYCMGAECEKRHEISDGSDYGTYFLVSCMTLPQYVKRYYPRSGPTIAVVCCSSPFFTTVSEVGGFFKPGFLMHNAAVERRANKNGWRRHLQVFATEP